MGRTNPTYRDRLDALEREWDAYRRGLRAAEQAQFDRLFAHGREYAHAAGYLNHPTPEFPLLVSILLAHERRLAALERQLDGGDDAKHAQADDPDAVPENDPDAVSEDDPDAVQD